MIEGAWNGQVEEERHGGGRRENGDGVADEGTPYCRERGELRAC